ncbi:hypothetical protein [Fervidibacter sacchari]
MATMVALHLRPCMMQNGNDSTRYKEALKLTATKGIELSFPYIAALIRCGDARC